MSVYDEFAISGQAQQGTHALDCNGATADEGKIGEGLVDTGRQRSAFGGIWDLNKLESVLDHCSSDIAVIAGEVEVLHFLGNSTELVESDQQFHPFGSSQVESVLVGDELVEEGGVCSDHGEGDSMLIGREIIGDIGGINLSYDLLAIGAYCLLVVD